MPDGPDGGIDAVPPWRFALFRVHPERWLMLPVFREVVPLAGGALRIRGAIHGARLGVPARNAEQGADLMTCTIEWFGSNGSTLPVSPPICSIGGAESVGRLGRMTASGAGDRDPGRPPGRIVLKWHRQAST